MVRTYSKDQLSGPLLYDTDSQHAWSGPDANIEYGFKEPKESNWKCSIETLSYITYSFFFQVLRGNNLIVYESISSLFSFCSSCVCVQECKIRLYLVTSDTIFILYFKLHLKRNKMCMLVVQILACMQINIKRLSENYLHLTRYMKLLTNFSGSSAHVFDCIPKFCLWAWKKSKW